LRQLGIGFAGYHSEFNDLFPAPGSKWLYNQLKPDVLVAGHCRA
jgi:hypothetical protein